MSATHNEWIQFRYARAPNSRLRSTILVGQNDLDLHLGKKVDDIFGSAIELGMTFLAAETLGFGDGDALQAEGLLHAAKLDERHARESSSWGAGVALLLPPWRDGGVIDRRATGIARAGGGSAALTGAGGAGGGGVVPVIGMG